MMDTSSTLLLSSILIHSRYCIADFGSVAEVEGATDVNNTRSAIHRES